MLEGIDPARLPRHVGVIMDGNGRWATARGLNRSQGHREGVKRAKELVERCLSLGIPCLSLFVFSTENWKRATDEVGFLMFLIRDHLREELDFYKANGIRVVHSGSLEELPRDVREVIESTCADSAAFNAMTVNLCINYGGRAELERALVRAMRDGAERAQSLAAYLDNPDLPELDLLIRSAGEKRISNFLLWQSAYAELHFSDTLWPDFGESDFYAALVDYSQRNRKFGSGVKGVVEGCSCLRSACRFARHPDTPPLRSHLAFTRAAAISAIGALELRGLHQRIAGAPPSSIAQRPWP